MSPAAPPPPRAGAGARAGEERYAGAGLLLIVLATAAWWGLAFWPVGGEAPEWLVRTRYVCFGVRGGTGLPDAGGWINLVGQPLGMLAALWVGWRRGVCALMARVRRSARLRAAALVVALPLAAAGSLAGWRVLAADDVAAGPDPGAVDVPGAPPVRLDRPAPPLALVDQHGAERTLEEFRGRPVLVTFAFGHCETVCPLLVRDVLEAQALLRAEPGAPVPAVLVVTVDPWRDTPARLPALARAWRAGEDVAILGGDIARVEAVLDAWGVARDRDPRTGDVAHAALVYVVDGAGRIAYAAPGGAEMLTELVRLAANAGAG
ncbi:MAG TPA: SCO family protein [Longimicrobiales bacterium]